MYIRSTIPLFPSKKVSVGKSKVCPSTEFSRVGDKTDFDGNTLLLDCKDTEYVYNSGLEIFKFKTDDEIIEYISLMGNNVVPYTFASGVEYTYFLSSHYKFIEGIFLKATNDSSDAFDYHLEKCGIDSLKALEHS